MRLLLAAFPPELAGLDTAPPAGWRVACTGVGAIAAAVTTARLISEMHPSRVLFMGTCGTYGPWLSIGDLICASEVISISLDTIEHRAFRPLIETTRWRATWPLTLPAHAVAATPGITKGLEGVQRLSEIAAVEHLELSGVFAACADADVPVAAALAVANHVGPSAHEEWAANHAAVSTRLRAELEARGVFDLS